MLFFFNWNPRKDKKSKSSINITIYQRGENDIR